MATVEQAEELEQRIAMEVGRDGVHVAARMANYGVGRLLNDLHKVRAAIGGASLHRSNESGSVRQFAAKVGTAQRDVVTIGDERVLKEMRSELRRQGVDFAVEREGKELVLHFRASDAKVLARALDRATERVDARIEDAAAKRDVAQRIEDRLAKTNDEAGRSRTVERDDPAHDAQELDDHERGAVVDETPKRAGDDPLAPKRIVMPPTPARTMDEAPDVELPVQGPRLGGR